MSRKTKDPDARREEFLNAARGLFDEKGFEATSVDDIVRKLGVAKGLFYYYFESKDAMLDTLIDRFMQEAGEAVAEVSSRDDLSAMQKIEALFEVSAGIRSRSKALVAYFHRPQNRYLHLDLERRMMEHIVSAMEAIIRQGVSEGVFHTDHPRETAVAYLATASALGHRRFDEMDDEEVEGFVAMFQDITERLFGAEPGTFDLYKKHLLEKLLGIRRIEAQAPPGGDGR